MNRITDPRDLDPLLHPLDALLADIAVNLQLPPGLHEKATGRYESVRNYAERDGSPLKDRVLRFYPQGSMAIDATISTRGTDDEYDLDIVAELDVRPDADPDEVLDLLYEALKGYPTSKGVVRQTRCVTVYYADGMHLDVTPASRLPSTGERESHIFHANPDEPATRHFHVPMNAYGFAVHYNERAPVERRFADAMSRRLFEANGLRIRADAEVDEVPDQIPLLVKSVTTVALQLLKRFRNIVYAEAPGRIPPSVMLSAFAAQAAFPGMTLSDMLVRQARLVANTIRAASARRGKVRVVNPVYPPDQFTDRWPETLAQQDDFASNLTRLANGIEALKRGDVGLEEAQAWLREQFGAMVVSRSVRDFNARTGRAVRNAAQAYTPRGGLYVPSAPALVGVGSGAAAVAVAAAPAVARPHTFMGGRR